MRGGTGGALVDKGRTGRGAKSAAVDPVINQAPAAGRNDWPPQIIWIASDTRISRDSICSTEI